MCTGPIVSPVTAGRDIDAYEELKTPVAANQPQQEDDKKLYYDTYASFSPIQKFLVWKQSNPEDHISCLYALDSIFVQVLTRGDFHVDHHMKLTNQKVYECEEQFAKWLADLYDKTWDLLLSLAQSKRSDVMERSYVTMMNILAAEGKYSLLTTDSFPFEKLKKIILTLLSPNTKRIKNIEAFCSYFSYKDIYFYSWKALKDVLLQLQESSDVFLTNFLDLLENMAKCEKKDDILCYAESNSKIFNYNEELQKKWIQKVWMKLISVNLSPMNHRKLLCVLLEGYLSKLRKPTLLTDFLFSSIAMEGATGLLALQGMSTLVMKHNLECPNIYGKLYNMFVIDAFHNRYKDRLFYLADFFLQSTHISEQLVAAFAKKLARLSLIVPACDLVLILRFVGNLLIRHPALVIMLHHTSSDPVPSDPYIMDEPDPLKSRAIESSLWELALLKNHVQPKVASAAKFVDAALPTIEWDIREYLNSSYSAMFQSEIKKNPKAEPSLTFVRPSYGIKQLKDDRLYKMWSLT